MWYPGAYRRLSFWLFLIARPIVYVGFYQLIKSRPIWFDSGLLNGSFTPRMFLYIFSALGLIAFGHILFKYAKKVEAKRIWDDETLKLQENAPILFLRSFRDDQLCMHRKPQNIIARLFDLWSFRRNVDELLIDEFAQFGPVIAIGNPRDKSVKFGAQRRFATDDTWRNIVSKAAESSQAIIVSASDTEGLLWEYELIKKNGYLDKTIFLFPPGLLGNKKTQSAISKFVEVFPNISLTHKIGHKPLIAISTKHDSEGVWTSDTSEAQSYLVALRRFFYGLTA